MPENKKTNGVIEKAKKRGHKLINKFFNPSLLQATTKKIQTREKKMLEIDKQIKRQ